MPLFRLFTLVAVAFRFGLTDILRAAASPGRTIPRRQKYKQPAPARLREAFEYLGPLFVKFGQLLSTRRDLLPSDYADELAKLQDRVTAESPKTILDIVQKTYHRPVPEIFCEFDDAPVGSASVAQVHRARLAENNLQVAVKILRPNINKQIHRDIKFLKMGARLVHLFCKDAARLKPAAVVDEFAKHLQNETDLLREAANCAQIGRNLSSLADKVRTPKVHWEWCRKNIMVMEFLPAVPVSQTAVLRAANMDLHALAKNGVILFFSQVFKDNLFHADMHPGNVHVDSAGRFVLLDYGIVGALSEFDKEYLARNFIAFFNRDYRRIAKMHVEAGWTPDDTPIEEFEASIRAVCEPIFAKPLKEISFGKFLLQMFQTARQFNLEVQPQLILLQKTLLSVEGMGRQLDPSINLWDTAKPFMEKWARRQYGWRRAAKIVREQSPDWLALLNDAPLTARLFIKQFKMQSEQKNRAVKKQLRRWQAATAALALILTAAVFWFLGRQ